MTEVKTELGPCTYGDSSKNSSSEDVVIDILLLILLVQSPPSLLILFTLLPTNKLLLKILSRSISTMRLFQTTVVQSDLLDSQHLALIMFIWH